MKFEPIHSWMFFLPRSEELHIDASLTPEQNRFAMSCVPTLQQEPHSDFLADGRVRLRGLLAPGSFVAYYWFEYGMSTNYGDITVPVRVNTRIPTGFYQSNLVTANIPFKSLRISTLYHFRLVAVNEYGTTYGEDMTFVIPGAKDKKPKSHFITCFFKKIYLYLHKTITYVKLRTIHRFKRASK